MRGTECVHSPAPHYSRPAAGSRLTVRLKLAGSRRSGFGAKRSIADKQCRRSAYVSSSRNLVAYLEHRPPDARQALCL
jgi:hypothetical protein